LKERFRNFYNVGKLTRYREESGRGAGILRNGYSRGDFQSTRFVGEKIYEVIDICAKPENGSGNEDCECVVLRTLKDKIRDIRSREDYVSLSKWNLYGSDLRRGIKTLSETLAQP
jgi:hypothetical protein